MENVSAVLLAGVCIFGLCSMVHSQDSDYYESFEDGVPEYFEATRPDSLSVSSRHSKQGNSSLRWDWSGGEELIIRHEIGDVDRVGGYHCRAAFAVWVYVEEPIADALVFEFREGEAITGSFRFPLEFNGWRQGRPLYSKFPNGQPTSSVDNIRIIAPPEIDEGTVFVDFIKYNTLTYRSGAVIPARVAQWQPPSPDEERFPNPEQVSEAQREGIRKLLGPEKGPGIEQTRVDELCEQVDALGIVRGEHGVHGGPGIDAHYQYLAAAGEQGIEDIRYWPDEHGPDWAGMETPARLSSLARKVATAYRTSNDDGQRQRLADAFVLVADHLHDQALQAGSGFRWHWWVGGSWADAVFLMRDVLKDAGKLKPHLDFILYTHGGSVIFDHDNPTSHMDFYHLTCPRLLHLCLLQVEPAEQVRWLRAFTGMLERSILQPGGALKVDGSAYHHRGHYHSYAEGAFLQLAEMIRKLRDTPWRLSAQAHERVRRAVLAQRIYANRIDLPVALLGRSPFAPGYRVISRSGIEALSSLAQCGTPDGTQEIDTEAAAAYLRLAPEAADNEPYAGLEIEPEPAPEGTFVMPYAGLLCHRRDNWLASIKGQSTYVWGSERQARRNCHGLFQGLGNLEILAGGDPVTAEASGRQAAGWDWRRFEGTTVPQLPLDDIAAGWPSSRPRSPETFLGGVSYDNRQGVFGMILNQPMPGDHTLTGRKSWFFEDERILCLGSSISCDDAEYPTQTTVCQKAVRIDDAGGFLPTPVDGAPFAAFPETREPDQANPHWFLDVQDTGYYVPAGQNLVIARKHQVSRNYLDSADTEGDFLTAWIDHGTTPENAGYEYMLVVQATPETMQALVDAPPYRVIQRDQEAHIVRHTAARRWSCVCFVPQQVQAHTVDGETLPIAEVDRPCLVMAEAVGEGRLAVSVADPDLNLENGASKPRPLHVTVRGSWDLQEAAETVCAWDLPETDEEVGIVSADAQKTVLEIICRHGATYDIQLARNE